MTATSAAPGSRRTNVRWWIVVFLFFLTAVNYGDRATLSVVNTQLSDALKLDPAAMGWLLSAFGWAYALCQIPGGWLLDKFGTKRIYFWSIALWSLCTIAQGFVGGFGPGTALGTLFVLRFLLGVAESPSFPGNARIVAAWFPTAERGTASAIFNSAQYFATVLFTWLMGRITHEYGWPQVFWFMGSVGLLFAVVWPKLIHGPREHPRVNAAEIAHIEHGGGLVDMDRKGPVVRWSMLGQLLGNRMLLGIYLAQYCITTLTWFFLTWFPAYLQRERGMNILEATGWAIVLPALCGFIGGITGGFFSDHLLRRGFSLTLARKIPIIFGMMLSMVIIGCNYVAAQGMVIALMALAYFGKGVGALGWAVASDVSPKEITGLNGGLFNMFGNLAGITTPIAIGYIVKHTGSFNGALLFVGLHALFAMACYLFVVGEIKRVELKAA